MVNVRLDEFFTVRNDGTVTRIEECIIVVWTCILPVSIPKGQHLTKTANIGAKILEDRGSLPKDGVRGVERAICRDVEAYRVDGVAWCVQDM